MSSISPSKNLGGVVDSPGNLSSLQHAREHNFFRAMKVKNCLCFPALQQRSIPIPESFGWKYTFLFIKKLSLLLAPGKAINKEVGPPILRMLNEAEVQDVADVVVRNEGCVAHDGLNLEIAIERWPYSVFPQQVTDRDVHKPEVCGKSCALGSFAYSWTSLMIWSAMHLER